MQALKRSEVSVLKIWFKSHVNHENNQILKKFSDCCSFLKFSLFENENIIKGIRENSKKLYRCFDRIHVFDSEGRSRNSFCRTSTSSPLGTLFYCNELALNVTELPLSYVNSKTNFWISIKNDTQF